MKAGAQQENGVIDNMTTESMIQSAKYGIVKMKEGNEFDYYFRGTLACLKGVLDHLLEEYNKKFGLQISGEVNLGIKTFRKAAKKSANNEAVRFIDFFENERNSLFTDSRVGLLLEAHGVRDQEIHREEQPRDLGIVINEMVTARASFRVERYDANGRPIWSTTESEGARTPSVKRSEVRYYLQSWNRTEDIPALCEYCMKQLEAFVLKCRSAFP